MRYIFPPPKPETVPPGKRSIRRTVYGNINGYVAGRFWKTFGPCYDASAERDAEEWLQQGKESSK